MEMNKILLLLFVIVASAAAQKVKFKLPKAPKEFTWGGKFLTDRGKINGIFGTGTWKPPNTRNSFTGTGSWQNGRGFGGSLKGSVGVGKRTSFTFGLGGGGGRGTRANIGIKMKFRRRRRNAMARALFHL